MLVFDNEEHFADYIEFLETAIDPQSYDSAYTNKDGEFDQHAILETVESYLGFASVRKQSHDNFMAMNEIGWESLESIPAEHFISDMVIRSVLNENLTTKIGSNYVHIINKSLSVKVDASKTDLLTAFNNLHESATLNDALSIDRGHQFSAVYETSLTGELSTFGGGNFGAHTLGYVSIINLAVQAPDCNNPKKKVFSNMQMFESGSSYGDPGNSMAATFVIDFGDGTPHLTIHSAPNGLYQIVPAFTHIYANEGNYTVHISAQADGYPPGGGITTATLNHPVEVRNTSCATTTNKKIGVEQFHPVPDGSRAVSGRITVDNYTNWGVAKTRIVSETSSWIRDGNHWKQSKAEIWGNLHTTKHDIDCNTIGQVDGDGWSSKSKHITVHRTDNRYPWDIVNTNHAIKYQSIWHSSPQSLSVCN